MSASCCWAPSPLTLNVSAPRRSSLQALISERRSLAPSVRLLFRQSAVQSGSWTTYKAGGWLGTIHNVRLPGLKPATRYYYQVGSQELGVWSETFSFLTAPANLREVTFALIGDMV